SAIVRVTWVRVPHVHRDGGGSVGADREHVQIMECLTCPGGAAVVANLDIDHHGSRSVRCPVTHPHPTPARQKKKQNPQPPGAFVFDNTSPSLPLHSPPPH